MEETGRKPQCNEAGQELETLANPQPIGKNGAPGAIPTRDLPLRRRTLYAAELREHTASKLTEALFTCPEMRQRCADTALGRFLDTRLTRTYTPVAVGIEQKWPEQLNRCSGEIDFRNTHCERKAQGQKKRRG